MPSLNLNWSWTSFCSTQDFYNDVIGVLDKYNVVKEDKDLCMLLGKKNSDGAHANVILDELKKAQLDFDQLCTDVFEI